MSEKTEPTSSSADRFIAEAREEQRQRLAGYREQALKLYPWVCARCTREFSGKKVRELTVHHKDHNHDNNPPDGSNWELLCIYCHDHEHTRGIQDDRDSDPDAVTTPREHLSHSPFAALGQHFKKNK